MGVRVKRGAASLGISMALVGCGSSEPIVVRPQVPFAPVAACGARGTGFEIVRVDDVRGYSDVRNVGFTQTGLFNVKASLELDTPAAVLVRRSLQGALEECGRNGIGRPLAVQLVTLQVNEEDTWTKETLTATTRYDVIALQPATLKPLGRFIVDGKSARSGIDTTDDAEPAITEAIRASLPEFLRGLAFLPNPAVGADAPATAGKGTPGSLRVSLRRLTEEEERKRFGTSLGEQAVLAIEVTAQRSSDSSDVLEFHRQDFRLMFPSGRVRVPLDPLKVREFSRVVPTTMVYAGGAVFPVDGPASLAKSENLESAVDALRLGNARRDFKGVLFFDMQGVGHDETPSSLDVFFTDVTSGKLWHVTAKYPKSESSR